MKSFYFIALFASIILISCNENKTSDTETETALKKAITEAKEDSVQNDGNDMAMYKFRQSKRRAAAFLDSLKISDPDLYDGLFFELYKSDK